MRDQESTATLKRKTRTSKGVKKRRTKGLKRDIWRALSMEGQRTVEAGHLPGPLRTTVSDLQIVQLSFERLDIAMSNLQVLVETVTFGDELLMGG
jgi:hypothetical protein